MYNPHEYDRKDTMKLTWARKKRSTIASKAERIYSMQYKLHNLYGLQRDIKCNNKSICTAI